MEKILKLIQEKAETEAVVSALFQDPSIIPSLISFIKFDPTSTKFACEKALRGLAEKHPETLIPYFDLTASLLSSSNSFLRYGTIFTLAFLIQADEKKQFLNIFETYFDILNELSMIPAANVASVSWKFVLKFPELETEITNRLLKTEQNQYYYKNEVSPECKNIVLGNVIECFDHYFDFSQNQIKMMELVQRQLSNSRPQVAQKAKRFMKNHIFQRRVLKKAFAKVNLFLNVRGKRPNGYHNLEMINARIDLSDDLLFSKEGKETVTIFSNDAFLENKNNLVFKVATYLMNSYAPLFQTTIHIEKRIPSGAGLGGNSADAAAVIQGLDELYQWHLPQKTKQEIALMFGADIPYCLEEKPCLVEGIGEQITPLDLDLSNYSVLLCHPDVYVATEDVFKVGDEYGFLQFDIQPVLSAIRENNIERMIELLHNSLTPITHSLSPKTKQAQEDFIAAFGKRGVVMTGSGSTLLKIINNNQNDVLQCPSELSEKYSINIYRFL